MSKKTREPNILGIETTCDETAASVLIGGRIFHSNEVYSQVSLHKKFCGVVPEIASRAHSEKISAVILKAMQKLKTPPDAVCFASGPGLPGALLVGKVAAETIAKLLNIEAFGINHLEGHILACEIEDDKIKKPLKFPLIALIVSGGHTELWKVLGYGVYKILGSTRDDAAGEAFDKVSKLLKLGYPGGPKIEQYALKGRKDAISFPKHSLKNSWEFSFSGLKTSVSYYLRDNKNINKFDVCAAFQAAVVDTLVFKTIKAANEYNVTNIVVAGGVSANGNLRAAMNEECKKHKFKLFVPQKKLCADNAAMIALAGYRKKTAGAKLCGLSQINPQLKIKSWSFN